jgi:hypothetical protein
VATESGFASDDAEVAHRLRPFLDAPATALDAALIRFGGPDGAEELRRRLAELRAGWGTNGG